MKRGHVIKEYLEPVAWLVAAPNSEGYKRRAVSIVEIPPALHHLGKTTVNNISNRSYISTVPVPYGKVLNLR